MGFETMTEAECLQLLATRWLGRVGVNAGALPAIFPVAYALDGPSVVFRTSPGSKLDAIGAGQVICFEVDEAERASQTGWSVLVVGRAREVTDPGDVDRADALGIERWPSPFAEHYVRLPVERVSGRRLQSEVMTPR